MDRQSATPEDLPPLELRKLRDLEVREPAGPGRPSHMSAASGVVRRGDFVYVIGDDELHLGVFEVSSGEPGQLVRVLSGELPDDHGERSKQKPDLEALTLLPPFEEHPYGALLGLGSGSGPDRDRGFVCALGADGSLGGDPREVDLAPVYELLREHIAELNVEGAATMADRLWLLQRGNSELGSNVVAELSLDHVMASLREDLRIDAHELANVRSYELGDIDGVELTFSDATPIAEQLVVFTASAEADDGKHPRLGRGNAAARRRGRAAAHDRPQVEGRGRARCDGRRRARLHLRLRSGRPGRTLAAAVGHDAARRQARVRPELVRLSPAQKTNAISRTMIRMSRIVPIPMYMRLPPGR